MTARTIKIFFTLFILIGCSSTEKKNDIHVQYAHEIIHTFAKEMEKECDLVCIGSGGGMPCKIEEINVAFAAYRKGSIDEARELEIKGTEKLLKIVNENEKIRPYLQEHPFQHNRAYVSISFRQKNECRFLDSVSLVFQANDQIYYCALDPLKNVLTNLLVESYEEAKNRICQTNSSMTK